jgi:DNA polymerase III epsilon subunit-like protein
MTVAVVDFETTGKHLTDYPVSVGALVVNVDGYTIYPVDSLYSLIRIPDPGLANDTTHIHGITPAMVAEAPEPVDVALKFVFLKGDNDIRMLAAWNVAFDRGFLGRLFEMAGARPPTFRWCELQVDDYAKLDNYVPYCRCSLVKSLPGHHALADCARELAVYADHYGYEVDVESLKQQIVRHMPHVEKKKSMAAEA